QLVEAGGQVRFVEHAEHAFLPMHRGQEGNTQIVVLAADLDAHAAVLRQAALGDVQAAHDLEPGGEGELHLLGRGSHVHQHTVHAVTQAHHAFEGFNVNVAGAVLDGLDENQVGQLDDGSLFAGRGELVEIDLFECFLGELQVVRILVIIGRL